MDKLSYYMAGRNVMSENDYEAKMMAGNPRIQAALNSSKRHIRKELDGAGLTRNRISKKEFANKATVRPQGNETRYAHTDGRMMKRMGKQAYNNLVKQAYEDIMGFEKEAFAPDKPDFSKLPGSTGPTVPKQKVPKGPWVKSDGVDDNKKKLPFGGVVLR